LTEAGAERGRYRREFQGNYQYDAKLSISFGLKVRNPTSGKGSYLMKID